MTTNHHTDISVGAAVDASVVNAPDGQLDSAITQMLNGSKSFAQLNFTDTTLVLASDSITVTNSAHRVDTEGAAAADNLQTIVGGVDGDLLLLQSVAAARVVTAKHNLATLWHGNEADFVFDDPRHTLLYLYDSANLRYCEVGRPVGMEKIITHTQLGSSVASVTLSFSAVYRHLFLVGGVRTDRAATTDDLIVRYNADATAANYGSTGAAFSTGAAYQEVLTTVATGNIVYFAAAGATAPANSFGSFNLTIENALSTTLIRNMHYQGFVRGGTTTALSGHSAGGGWWNNTSAAISSITILPRTGTNLVSGSHYTLYGWM